MDRLEIGLVFRVETGFRLVRSPVHQGDTVGRHEGAHRRLRNTGTEYRTDLVDLLKVVECLAVVADIDADPGPGRQQLPRLEQGETVNVKEVASEEKETKPPRRYTEKASHAKAFAINESSVRRLIFIKTQSAAFLPGIPTLASKGPANKSDR